MKTKDVNQERAIHQVEGGELDGVILQLDDLALQMWNLPDVPKGKNKVFDLRDLLLFNSVIAMVDPEDPYAPEGVCRVIEAIVQVRTNGVVA